MELIDLKEKEVFQKQGRGMANLVDEPYQQINQARLEPGQEVSITIPESDSSRRKMSITDGLNKLSKNVRQF